VIRRGVCVIHNSLFHDSLRRKGYEMAVTAQRLGLALHSQGTMFYALAGQFAVTLLLLAAAVDVAIRCGVIRGA
jgi:hypothetical protein